VAQRVKSLWAGAGGVVLAAVVSGIFLLLGRLETPPVSPEPSPRISAVRIGDQNTGVIIGDRNTQINVVEGGKETPLPRVALPTIKRLSPEEVERYERETGTSGAELSTTKRLISREGPYGDKILAEAEVTAIGPAPLPEARRSTSMPASRALDTATVAASEWAKTAKLVYVVAGTLDVAYSATKGFYLQVYRWIFLYRSSAGSFLLVCVDPELDVAALVEWSSRQSVLQQLRAIDGAWKIDSVEATEAVIELGAMPTASPPFLRMNDIRGRDIPTWILPFNGSYIVSALDKTLLFDPLDEAVHSGLVTEFRNEHGEAFQGFSTQESLLEEFVRRFGEPPATKYKVVRDFRTRVQLIHRFPKWTTYFHYDDPVSRFYGVATSATVQGRSAQTLATGRLMEIFDGGVRVSETHYDGAGKEVYKGEITFEAHLGVKTGERRRSGLKKTEYFFFWTS